MDRALFRRHDCAVHARAGLGAAPSAPDTPDVHRHRGARGLLYVVGAQGILPAAGHRRPHRVCPMRLRISPSTRWCTSSTGSSTSSLTIRMSPPGALPSAARRPVNNGLAVHRSEAARSSARPPPIRSSCGCAASSPRCPARQCSCRLRRTSTWAGAPRAPSTSTRCRTRIWTSSTTGRRSCWRPSQNLPQVRDVASDQQTSGTMLSLVDRPRSGCALRHPAGPDRSDALRCLWAASGDPVLHAAQCLSRDPGGHAEPAGRSQHPQQALHQVTAHRTDGAAVDAGAFRHASADRRCRSITRAPSPQ